MSLFNFIGRKLLRKDQARVLAPPGQITIGGRMNILLATPMRSGTHVTMDLLLNSMPLYRRLPLYVDLDRFLRRGMHRAVGGDITRAGYVLKTHFPAGQTEAITAEVTRLAEAGCVVVVDRPAAEIRRSLERWNAEEPGLKQIAQQLAGLDDELAAFEAFWSRFAPYRIAFRDLFDPQACARIVTEIGARTGQAPEEITPPRLAPRHPGAIYLNKALTRALGRHAPRIDTTIRALR